MSHRDIPRASLLWIVLVFVFFLAGGLGAGVVAGLYRTVVGEPFSEMLYAITFAACGYIAVQLGFRIVDHRAPVGKTRP